MQNKGRNARSRDNIKKSILEENHKPEIKINASFNDSNNKSEIKISPFDNLNNNLLSQENFLNISKDF